MFAHSVPTFVTNGLLPAPQGFMYSGMPERSRYEISDLRIVVHRGVVSTLLLSILHRCFAPQIIILDLELRNLIARFLDQLAFGFYPVNDT